MQHQFLDLAKSVSGVKDDVRNLTHKVNELSTKQPAIESHLKLLRDRVASLEEKTERQEQYSRRENVILHGISEHPGETFEASEDE